MPVRNTVVAAGDSQVGMAAAVFNPNQENRFVSHLARTGVEHGVRRIGPVLRREDRVVWMAVEQLGVQVRLFRFPQHSGVPEKRWLGLNCPPLPTGDGRLRPRAQRLLGRDAMQLGPQISERGFSTLISIESCRL